eukprot:4589170-Pyramimonas_sp.AAC.1
MASSDEGDWVPDQFYPDKLWERPDGYRRGWSKSNKCYYYFHVNTPKNKGFEPPPPLPRELSQAPPVGAREISPPPGIRAPPGIRHPSAQPPAAPSARLPPPPPLPSARTGALAGNPDAPPGISTAGPLGISAGPSGYPADSPLPPPPPRPARVPERQPARRPRRDMHQRAARQYRFACPFHPPTAH